MPASMTGCSMASISVSRVRIRQVSIRVAGVGNPRVGVIMGSDSDLPTMQGAIDVLVEFGVAYEARVISAHRTPEEMLDYARQAADRGLEVIIAGAGGAAHLPGMTASMTPLPVIGVPVPLKQLEGLDSLLSIVQMPAGIPVATVAIGNARNAGFSRYASWRTATRSCAPRWSATRPTSRRRSARRTPSSATRADRPASSCSIARSTSSRAARRAGQTRPEQRGERGDHDDEDERAGRGGELREALIVQGIDHCPTEEQRHPDAQQRAEQAR